MPHPSKPWTNGQTHEIYSGKTFQYNASANRWVLISSDAASVTNTDQDSDIADIKYRLNNGFDFGVFESLREMKAMIAREVKQKKKEHKEHNNRIRSNNPHYACDNIHTKASARQIICRGQLYIQSF